MQRHDQDLGQKAGKMRKNKIIIHVWDRKMGIIHTGQHHAKHHDQDLGKHRQKREKIKLLSTPGVGKTGIIRVWGRKMRNYLGVGQENGDLGQENGNYSRWAVPRTVS